VASKFLSNSVQGNLALTFFKLITGSHKLITEKLIKSLTDSHTDFQAANSKRDLFHSFHHNQAFEIKFSIQYIFDLEKSLTALLSLNGSL